MSPLSPEAQQDDETWCKNNVDHKLPNQAPPPTVSLNTHTLHDATVVLIFKQVLPFTLSKHGKVRLHASLMLMKMSQFDASGWKHNLRLQFQLSVHFCVDFRQTK